MTVHELKTKAEFSEAIKEHKVVIIDASATWCGPCKAISPFFHKLSENPDFASVYFTKFDVDEVPDIAQELGIRAMPTFAVFVDGEQKDTLMGGHPPKLQELVTKYASA